MDSQLPSYRLDSNDPFNKWSEFCNDNGYKPKSKKLFKEVFDELVGNIPTKTRVSTGGNDDRIEIYAYTGIRIKTAEEFESEDQTHIDSQIKTDNSKKALKDFMDSTLSMIINTMNSMHTLHTKIPLRINLEVSSAPTKHNKARQLGYT